MEMRDIMSKIAILTDSSCDIPQEMAEKYGIDIMSFHILLDNVDYVERESCTNTEFYDKMRAAKGVPSTAAITPIQFCEKYCQYVDEGYTDVIHVPINRSGSSTYNNAVMAQGMLREERPEHHLNIHLLDPHTYSMVFGWYLCEMARKAVKDVDNDGLTDIYGLNTGADIPWYILPMLWSHGGSIRQADGSYHIDTKEMKEILTIYAGLVKDGVIPANQHKTAREDFQNGKSLFLFISCATTSKILTNVNGAFEIGLTSIMKDQTKSIGLGAYGLSIFKDTNEKATMSAEFIRFMTLPENAIRTCLAKPGPLPFTKTQMADETIMARYEDPYNKAVLAQSDYIQGEGVTPVDAIVWNEIVTLMSKIEADPDLDLDKELSRIQTEMDDYMMMY